MKLIGTSQIRGTLSDGGITCSFMESPSCISGMSGIQVAFATTTCFQRGGEFKPEFRAFTRRYTTFVYLFSLPASFLLPTRRQLLANPFLISADPLSQRAGADIELLSNFAVRALSDDDFVE